MTSVSLLLRFSWFPVHRANRSSPYTYMQRQRGQRKNYERKTTTHLVKVDDELGSNVVTPVQADEVHSEPATQRSEEPVSRMRSNV